MATVIAKPATLDDFLRAEAEAPEGTRLALIDGEIVEWRANMTTRNARHSAAMMRIGDALIAWLESHPEVVGVVAGGEARCCLTAEPERIVGLDAGLFIGAEHVTSACVGNQFNGSPVIAVEILSGSDTHDDTADHIRVFLESGVKEVWIVDAELRRVTINRPDGDVEIFTARHDLTAEPELPGFRVSVDSLFPKFPH